MVKVTFRTCIKIFNKNFMMIPDHKGLIYKYQKKNQVKKMSFYTYDAVSNM